MNEGSSKRQSADLDELINIGVIQEANRRFFHILGLELVARVDPARGLTLDLDDCRSESLSVHFTSREPEWSEVRRTRAQEVSALLEARLAMREDLLGYGVQPLADL